MRAVVQRVQRAEVRSGPERRSIGPGLLVFVGLEAGDTEATCAWAAGKLAGLRIFADGSGKLNLSVGETDGEILAVSQFTLAGSLARGRRPSFDRALPPGEARPLFDRFVALLRSQHPRVATGFFREHMEVELVNDGPVTFILERGGDASGAGAARS